MSIIPPIPSNPPISPPASLAEFSYVPQGDLNPIGIRVNVAGLATTSTRAPRWLSRSMWCLTRPPRSDQWSFGRSGVHRVGYQSGDGALPDDPGQ